MELTTIDIGKSIILFIISSLLCPKTTLTLELIFNAFFTAICINVSFPTFSNCFGSPKREEVPAAKISTARLLDFPIFLCFYLCTY